MKNKLEELKKDKLIELSCYSNFNSTPGVTRTIITKDYQVYHYHKYKFIQKEVENEIQPEKLFKIKSLNKETITKLNKLIEEKIINKNHEDIIIHDAFFTIQGKYRNQNFHINNNIDLYNEFLTIIK